MSFSFCVYWACVNKSDVQKIYCAINMEIREKITHDDIAGGSESNYILSCPNYDEFCAVWERMPIC